ncbi:MAG: redoxin domain-containing protein [Myxococcales bacterium]|nr:redoxin domain-containing protein [Myxococcales bacterium]MCB9568911.1 redoxin domain-containing protein [Myxococcales bacterium]MCB9704923.1 redoxin domain-containing protein [Myxococcales bacterium]
MISPGTPAPNFTLGDHFGRRIELASFRGRKHVMLVFYPLDFTPT